MGGLGAFFIEPVRIPVPVVIDQCRTNEDPLAASLLGDRIVEAYDILYLTIFLQNRSGPVS